MVAGDPALQGDHLGRIGLLTGAGSFFFADVSAPASTSLACRASPLPQPCREGMACPMQVFAGLLACACVDRHRLSLFQPLDPRAAPAAVQDRGWPSSPHLTRLASTVFCPPSHDDIFTPASSPSPLVPCHALARRFRPTPTCRVAVSFSLSFSARRPASGLLSAPPSPAFRAPASCRPVPVDGV